jgi:hypothetical protein
MKPKLLISTAIAAVLATSITSTHALDFTVDRAQLPTQIITPGGAVPSLATDALSQDHRAERIAARMDAVAAKLSLTPSQQALLVEAKRVTHDAAKTGHDAREAFRAESKLELAKAKPNLAQLAADHDALAAAMLTNRHAARAKWLALYDTLSETQVAALKAELQPLVTRLQGLRARLTGLFGGLM